MENVFLTPNSPSSPSGFSKVQIFQKIVYSLRKHFFRHPGKNNRLFEENVLLIQEVRSFNPKNRHPSPDPFDSIEPSISTEIEISMFCVGNVFLILRTDKKASKQFFYLRRSSTSEKNFKKLTPDSNSSIPITLRSTLIKTVTKRCFFDPADRQPSRQFIFPRLFSTRKRKRETCLFILAKYRIPI